MLDPVTKTESKMDWDEEEITQPGPAPAISFPFEEAPPSGYPQIDASALQDGDKCYLCASKRYVTRFFRSPTDGVNVCVGCLYTHLRWELHEDGSLTPVPSE